MMFQKTLAEIMAEPARPARRTLAKIMGVADRPSDDDAIPTTEGPLRTKLAEWDAEIARIKDELFARRLAVKPLGERDLAASVESELNRHLGRLMVVRDEIAGRLQRCLQARALDEMHSTDGETRAELAKLRGYATAIVEKRAEPVSDAVRAELARAISVREIRLAAR